MAYHTYIPQKVEITKDGLTYCITVRMHDGQEFDGLLTEDYEGWLLHDRKITHRIGRRASWVKALHDALAYIGEQFAKGA